MNKIVTAGFACGCMLVSNAAFADSPVWQGQFMVTSVANCPNESVGEFGTMDYRPKILSTDTPDKLAVFFPRNAFMLTSAASSGSLRGSVQYTASAVFSNGNSPTYSGTSSLTLSPATITASTAVITMKGQIVNFADENSGACTVTFTAYLVPKL